MTIDTGALVEPLAYAICAEQDRRCACAEIPADYRLPCEDAERSARAAIAYLLPLIIERCAEVATPKYDAPCGCTSCCCGKLDDAENQAAWREATHITARIRALIQKEADHGSR